MIDPLVAMATRRPDAPALADATSQRSWRDLRADANDLARRLQVSPTARVGLLSRDTADAVVAIHAVRLTGATLVPLNRRLAVAELVSMLARSDTTRLLHDQHHAGEAAQLAAAVPGLHGVPLGRAAAVSEPGRLEPLDPAAIAAVVFTSGTTGVPRGVCLTHTNLLSSAASWNAFLEAREDDHWLATLPLSHVAGLGTVLRSMVSGARLTVHDRFDAAAVIAALADDAVTHMSLVPTQLARLLDTGRVVAPRLRALLLGGAPIPADLVLQARSAGLPIVTTYGMTEAASGITALSPDEVEAHPGSSGRRLPGFQIRVLLDDGTDAPSGTWGNIEVAGPSVFAGYDHDQAATDVALRDGWLRTGDMGSLDDERRLTVADRRDDLIISGGENVSPVEVEMVLMSHPEIEDAAVVGRNDPVWGAVPVAAVVWREETTTNEVTAIQAFCRERLAGYKVPVAIGVVPAIPRTTSGKIRRQDVLRLLDSVAADLYVERPDGAQIHVRRRGNGPLLVLLHATLSNALELDPLAIELSGHHTVLAIDRRSSGASVMPPDDTPAPIDVRVHIDDILAVLDSLAPREPVFVVGHSYGACVGLEFAARRPERVLGAFLFEPPYLGVLPGSDAASLALGERITTLARRDGMGAAALAFLETVNGAGISRRLPPDVLAQFMSEGRAAVADSALAGFRPDGLADVRADIRLGIGGRSRGPYPAVAAALLERIPTLRVEQFPTLGHGGPIGGAAIVTPAILASFLAMQPHLPAAPAPGGTP